MRIRDEGTIIMLIPEQPAERDWLEQNVSAEPWQWLGPNLCIEWRYFEPLATGLIEAGFTLVEE